MKKKEAIIVALFVVVLAAILLVMNFTGNQDARRMIISVNGEEYQNVALTDQTNLHFTVDTPYGYNEVVVTNGVVDMVSADCDNQVCVETKPASRVGDTIVCLPHKLIIEIVNAKGDTD